MTLAASAPLRPVALTGAHVRLEPLVPAHADALWEVARDPALWTLSTPPVRSRADFDAYLAQAWRDTEHGSTLTFATCSRSTGAVVGSTRFAAYAPEHARVEIGWTWIARGWQRTAVNTEAKLLMLAHAFETLGVERVELKTDALNARSRAAITRLGATEEGTLRHHMRTSDGRRRDTVYFSILAAEWPSVRAGLEARLAGGAAPP